MATTYNNLYMDIRQELHRAGIDAATLEARELVAFAAGKTRQELLRDGRLYVSEEVEQRATALMRRHLAGEPLAYLIGEWSFCGMDLDIDENVLIPRTDTEVLAEQAIDFIKTLPEPRVLDLCAGSGCLGLAVKSRCPAARVTAVEKSAEALPWLQKNAAEALPGFDAAHPALNVQQGDVFQWNKGQAEGQFDLILANPPYLTAEEMRTLQPEVEFEPAMALDGGEDGLDFYRHIAKAYRPLTKPGGWLVMEFGWQQWEPVKALLEAAGWQDVQRILDAEGRDRGAAARNG